MRIKIAKSIDCICIYRRGVFSDDIGTCKTAQLKDGAMWQHKNFDVSFDFYSIRKIYLALYLS